MTMPKQRGNANSETKRTERRKEEEVYNPQPNSQSKMQKVQKQEYFIKNACYSPAKYYLCKQNNKRSLLGRKQRSQVARSFPNRYQYSYTKKVTSLFSIRYILIIILACKRASFTMQKGVFYKPVCNPLIIHMLQSWFLLVFVHSTVEYPFFFVRLFHKPQSLVK